MSLADIAAAIDNSRRSNGRRRSNGPFGRTRALAASIGVLKRTEQVPLVISADAHAALLKRAGVLNVHATGLAAFLIESTLQADRCRAGHDLTPDNLRKEADGTRRCRACKRAYDLAHKARRNQARRDRKAAARMVAESRGTT